MNSQSKNQIKAIYTEDMRELLDTIELNDVCNGWRSIKQLVSMLAKNESETYGYRMRINHWLATHNREDKVFETDFIDGEMCYRSHKFFLSRDAVLRTALKYQKILKEKNVDRIELQLSYKREMLSALQPIRSARREKKVVPVWG